MSYKMPKRPKTGGYRKPKGSLGNIYQTTACYKSSRCSTPGAAASQRHLSLMYRNR